MFSGRILVLRHNFSEETVKMRHKITFSAVRDEKKYFLNSFVQSITNILPGQEIQWQGVRVTQRVGGGCASDIQMSHFGQNDGFSKISKIH